MKYFILVPIVAVGAVLATGLVDIDYLVGKLPWVVGGLFVLALIWASAVEVWEGESLGKGVMNFIGRLF